MFNVVDLIIMVVVAAAAFYGLSRGFLRRAIAVFGFVAGVYAAVVYHGALATGLGVLIGGSDVATPLAFILILIMVWFGSGLLAGAATGGVRVLGLQWADRLLGLLVGLLGALLVLACLLLLFVRFPVLGSREAIQQSVLASLVFRVLPHLKRLLPSDLRLFTAV